MTGLRAGSQGFEPTIDGGGHEHRVHDYHHLTPAPRVRAIVARSDNATVKRARFAFTTTTSSQVGRVRMATGNRAVFDRSSRIG